MSSTSSSSDSVDFVVLYEEFKTIVQEKKKKPNTRVNNKYAPLKDILHPLLKKCSPYYVIQDGIIFSNWLKQLCSDEVDLSKTKLLKTSSGYEIQIENGATILKQPKKKANPEPKDSTAAILTKIPAEIVDHLQPSALTDKDILEKIHKITSSNNESEETNDSTITTLQQQNKQLIDEIASLKSAMTSMRITKSAHPTSDFRQLSILVAQVTKSMTGLLDKFRVIGHEIKKYSPKAVRSDEIKLYTSASNAIAVSIDELESMKLKTNDPTVFAKLLFQFLLAHGLDIKNFGPNEGSNGSEKCKPWDAEVMTAVKSLVDAEYGDGNEAITMDELRSEIAKWRKHKKDYQRQFEKQSPIKTAVATSAPTPATVVTPATVAAPATAATSAHATATAPAIAPIPPTTSSPATVTAPATSVSSTKGNKTTKSSKKRKNSEENSDSENEDNEEKEDNEEDTEIEIDEEVEEKEIAKKKSKGKAPAKSSSKRVKSK